VTANLTSDTRAQRLVVPALATSIVASGLMVVGYVFDAPRFFQAYLMAYAFWLSLALGSLSIAFIQFLTGGVWGLAIRRVTEAAALTVWVLAVLFLPILLGLSTLYPWARPEIVAQDGLLQHKAAYLNVPFFIARAVVYFACWCGLSLLLRRWSDAEDVSAESFATGRLQRLSIFGILLLAISVSFAAIDWLMSLEPRWYSTIYAPMVALGMILGAFGFAILMVLWQAPGSPLEPVATRPLLNDLGSLLLAFLMLWAYLAYFQYLLIWTGNLSEEIVWFVVRLNGSWQLVALIVALAGFAVPFILLLFRGLKRDVHWLGRVAGIVLTTQLITTYWLIEPAFFPAGIQPHWLDAAALAAIGGAWLAAFGHMLASRPLIPSHDIRYRALVEHAHG
jgi:hypothetical protein